MEPFTQVEGNNILYCDLILSQSIVVTILIELSTSIHWKFISGISVIK
jgi:hypothetical protein